MSDAFDLTNPLAPFTEDARPSPIHHDDLRQILAQHQPFFHSDEIRNFAAGDEVGVRSMTLEWAIISDFQFEHQLTEFEFASCAFIDCHFYGSDLTSSLFSACLFERCTFDMTSLRKARLSGCRFIDVLFARSDLGKIRISHSRLTRTNFVECRFLEASISRCLLEQTVLSDDPELLARYNSEVVP